VSTDSSPPMGLGPRGARGRIASVLRALARWETGLVFVMIATVIYGARQSPNFLKTDNLFYIGSNIGETAIIAIPMALLIITGEIDLSVASILGLSGLTMAELHVHHGWPILAAMLAALVVGAMAGAFNGALVTYLGLPSLAVTIGTLALFRGIAQIINANDSVSGLPASLTTIGIIPIPHTQIPYSIAFFAVLAVIAAVVLHATSLGRSIFAIGSNHEAAFFSGIRVKRTKMWLFVLSGVISALAGILWTLRFASARYDAGAGLELDAITIALLGGISIFGGRGTLFGVAIAALILGALKQALTLAHISPQEQSIVIGALLLVSVIVPSGTDLFRRARDSIRAGAVRRRGQSASTEQGVQP
jgi:rhamnose transport system permease protein